MTSSCSGNLPGTKALRIEALTHESLPQRGPGRAGNGNFVLGDLQVRFAANNGSGGDDTLEAYPTNQHHPYVLPLMHDLVNE